MKGAGADATLTAGTKKTLCEQMWCLELEIMWGEKIIYYKPVIRVCILIYIYICVYRYILFHYICDKLMYLF